MTNGMEIALVSFGLALVLVFLVARFVMRNRRRQMDILAHGQRTVAELVAIQPTGFVVNGKTELALTLKLDEGSSSRQVEMKLLQQAGPAPKVGDRVQLLMDARDPNALTFLGLVSPDAKLKWAPALALDPAMVGNPRLRIAMVQSVTPAGELKVTLQSVIEPERTVTTAPSAEAGEYTAGHRVYLWADADKFTVVPLAETGGRPLAVEDTHLDVLVLGPQLLHQGAPAAATILEARQVADSGGYMREQGTQRWHLKTHIVAPDGTAWDHADTLTYSSADRAARICVVGKVVPVRYSPMDRELMMTDSLSLGLDDPFLLHIAAWNAAVQDGTVNDA